MLFFALFTVGYFFGVFTVLLVFPPQVKEIEEQERDALEPLIDKAHGINGNVQENAGNILPV